MVSVLGRYTRWLHTRWPAGTVEKLPEVGEDGRTAVPGLFVVGDLTGIPLLKFALDSGARVASAIADELNAPTPGSDPDVIIIGGGVSGMAAALEAQKRGLRFVVLESSQPFFTIANFPKAKPIYTYPLEMTPAGPLQVTATVKEALLDELQQQMRAAGITVTEGRAESALREGNGFVVQLADGKSLWAPRVVVAMGRAGDYRRLGVPGEDLDKVSNRLHDPKEFCDQQVLVVGGGDSALEAAVALAECGAQVTLSYRSGQLSRPRPENVARLHAQAATGRLTLALRSTVKEITAEQVVLHTDGGERVLPNDAVFAMIGREAPLAFFRRSRVPLLGELSRAAWLKLGLFVAFCTWLYNWKSGGFFDKLWSKQGWFPYNLNDLLGAAAADPSTLLGTLALSAGGPSFWYTLAYSMLVVIFGVKRIRRRKTPYITRQTLTLMAIQVVPLFLLPEILLPQMGYHGLLPQGLADALFPEVTYGHGREYWRAYGLILAWPLNVYNVMTEQPLPAWLWIAGVQTFALIPLGIWFFGKGVYCGWICSCGALAETLGDTLRTKMPHGPKWNRLNMLGQGILAVAVVLLLLRVASWVFPGTAWLDAVNRVGKDGGGAGGVFRVLNYKWTVDVLLAGVLGYGLYFWFSGRVWCRFACPLAALMHIYSRFSRFRILADKKKCISCNVCTSVCHQGIDVMNFANQGLPLNDPECVRCSACVQSCPTGVLSFGQVNRAGEVVWQDPWEASPVRMREGG